jgi:uncharacterized protein (TIGR02145 family)
LLHSVASLAKTVFPGFGGGEKKLGKERMKMQNQQGEPFIDHRDNNRVYRTVKIGSLIWMAENLKYNAPGSRCYEDKTENSDKYGRLYSLAMVTKLDACPPGWCLPTNAEWEDLVKAVGGSKIAGIMLKSNNGWDDYEVIYGEEKGKRKSGNGEDKFGFSALPGGYLDSDGRFVNVGKGGWWWSSVNESNNFHPHYWNMHSSREDVYDGYNGECLMYSVRCVRD